MRNRLFYLLACLLCLGQAAVADDFQLDKGVNISGWLSQSSLTGSARANYFTRQEVLNLKAMGFDHLRLPVAEDQLFVSRTGEKQTDVFNLLHQCIGWCQEAGMRVVVDMHTLHANTENTLWTSDETQQKLTDEWVLLADELKDYPNALVAFELLNEPTAPAASRWNQLAAKLIAAIRATQPERKIVVGSNDWENVNAFRYLTVPAGDDNIILSFHFYIPHPLTHYGAEWTYMAGIVTDLHYPGELISDESFNALTAAQQNALRSYRGYYDCDVLKAQIRQAVSRARELGGLQLYCGEYGCYKCERQSKLNWLTDVVSILNGFGIGASHWEYKQGFGFCDSAGNVVDQEVLDIITADGPRYDDEVEIDAPFVDDFETGSLLWQSQDQQNVTAAVVDNPLPGSANSSAKVLRINKAAAGWPAVQRNIEPLPFGPADQQYQFLHFKMKNDDALPLRIKLYDSSSKEYYVEYLPAAASTEWQDVVIYVGTAATSAGQAVDGNIVKLAIRPNEVGTLYVDDVYVSKTGQVQAGIGDAVRLNGHEKTNGDQTVYDLQGRRVGYAGRTHDGMRLSPGIYIVGGTKVAVR